LVESDHFKQPPANGPQDVVVTAETNLGPDLFKPRPWPEIKEASPVEVEEAARIVALRLALSVIALVALLALYFTYLLPTEPVAEPISLTMPEPENTFTEPL
jgi:hypothetical protein